MSLLWKHATMISDDERMAAGNAMPQESQDLYDKAGIKSDSPDYGENPDFDDAFDHVVGHADTGTEHEQPRCESCHSGPHRLDLSKPLRGNEKHFDQEHLNGLVNGTRKSKDDAPVVMEHKGENHIIDGHHRIIAAKLRGDSHIDVDLHHPDHILR